MGIKELLGRRRSENRIRRKTLKANKPYVDPNQEINEIVDNVSNRAYRFGSKMFLATQQRKAQGKEVIKHTVKHGIGEVYRGFVGPKKTEKIKPKLRKK